MRHFQYIGIEVKNGKKIKPFGCSFGRRGRSAGNRTTRYEKSFIGGVRSIFKNTSDKFMIYD